ncbi:MAG: hypothetical protein JKY34_12800 [Kordiimonadaceae bacterium]|nr:hypothetical protein [Kordiimonadaceae bacterium]
MKQILVRALVAGVVVAGVAGCAAPKKSGQGTKPVSHQASSGTGSQPSNQAKPSASKLVKQEKARTEGELELARVLSSKKATRQELSELGTCAGTFTALANFEKITGTPTGLKPTTLFIQYLLGGSFLATKSANVAGTPKPDPEKLKVAMEILQKTIVRGQASYQVLLKDTKGNQVALTAQVKTCAAKAPMLTYILSQMKPTQSQ